MLYVVVEHFKNDDLVPVYLQFCDWAKPTLRERCRLAANALVNLLN
jgi:hypothetical protein